MHQLQIKIVIIIIIIIIFPFNIRRAGWNVAKFILIKSSLGLSDIWQVRNQKKKKKKERKKKISYKFIQQHVTGFNLLTKRTF